MSNKKDGVLYVGVTTDLVKRVYQHKAGIYEGFSHKYHLKRLVYYEPHSSIEAAILKEKQMKKWNRDWKVSRIEDMNPEWGDLYESLF